MIRKLKVGISLLKKVFLVMAVFYFIISFFMHFINKDKPVYNAEENLKKSRTQLYAMMAEKESKADKSTKIALFGYRFSICAIMGELCTQDANEGEKYFKNSLLGKTSSLLAIPFSNPPASGTYYVSNILQNAGFIPNTYAAEGMGFAAIKPLMNLWKVFRDVSYLFIVLVLVSIGFMIMFRMKLNPQTVISVENALPKIVITLLLITFSFAIAGFLIDLMYLSIALIISVISNNNAYYEAGKMQNIFFQSNFGTLMDFMMPTQWNTVGGNLFKIKPTVVGLELFPRMSILGDAFMSMFPKWFDMITRITGISLGVFFIGKNISDIIAGTGIARLLSGLHIVGNSFGEAPHPILGSLLLTFIILALISFAIHGLGFIIGLLILFTFTGMLFNIFFLLIRSYLQIIVSIVLSPFILLFEALPGKSAFSFWIKGLIGELISFPVVIAVLLISQTLLNTMSSQGGMWTPPFLFQADANGLGIIIGMGLIFIIPDLIKFTKEAVGAKPLPFNIGAGTFFGGAGTLVGGGLGLMGQFSTMSLGLTAIMGASGKGDDTLLARVRGMMGGGKKATLPADESGTDLVNGAKPK